MKNKSMLLPILVLMAILVAACGATETSTSEPATPEPAMTEETVMPTETETMAPNETTTPIIPVTGNDENPARLSNQLDFNVWNQDGEEVGEVNDIILDLDNARISYVIVGTGGFLEIGEKDVLVPWTSLQLQSGDGSTTDGQQNVFVLQMDSDTFKNAPDVDLDSILPGLGQPAGDWDTDIRNYWENGILPATPDASATNAPDVVPTNTETMDQGSLQAMRLQGVALASDVLGARVNVAGVLDAPQSDVSNAVGATPTPDSNADNENMDDLVVSLEDVIINVNSGEIQYLIITSNFDDGEHWIPVPVNMLQWDATNEAFVLNADSSFVGNAPYFTEDQFPDFSVDGWDSDYNSYWQNAGAK